MIGIAAKCWSFSVCLCSLFSSLSFAYFTTSVACWMSSACCACLTPLASTWQCSLLKVHMILIHEHIVHESLCIILKECNLFWKLADSKARLATWVMTPHVKDPLILIIGCWHKCKLPLSVCRHGNKPSWLKLECKSLPHSKCTCKECNKDIDKYGSCSFACISSTTSTVTGSFQDFVPNVT